MNFFGFFAHSWYVWLLQSAFLVITMVAQKLYIGLCFLIGYLLFVVIRPFAPFSSQSKFRACHCCHCHLGTPIRQCSCFLLGSVRFILGAWQQLWDFLVSRGRGSWKSWAQIGGLSNWAIQGFGRRVQDNGENWQCVSMVSSDDTLLALPLFLSGKLVQCLLLSPPPTHPFLHQQLILLH